MNKIFHNNHSYKLILLNFFFLSFIFNTYSQNSCSTNFPNKCNAFGTPFGISQQSRSTTMQSGQKAQYNIVVYKDFVYRISLCTKKNIGGLYFRVLSTNTANKVLFDGSNIGVDKQEKILDIKYSCNLIIEVVFPKQELKTKRNKSEDVCITVLIEYYRKDNL